MPEPIITPVAQRSSSVSGHPAGILHRLGRGDHREMDEAVHLLLVLDRDPLGDVELAVGLGAGRHLAGDLAGRSLVSKDWIAPIPHLAVDQPAPDMLDADAERAGDAHAR